MFFYKGWFIFFATRVGRSYLQLEKSKKWKKKIKSKKGLCTIQKVKTKNITNESFQFRA